MGTIVQKYETKYNVGDVVIFEKHNKLEVGIIEGYYVEDHIFWFNIRTSSTNVYTYSNKGDIMEGDIIGKLEGDFAMKCKETIMRLR